MWPSTSRHLVNPAPGFVLGLNPESCLKIPIPSASALDRLVGGGLGDLFNLCLHPHGDMSGLDALQPFPDPDGNTGGGLDNLSKLCPHPDKDRGGGLGDLSKLCPCPDGDTGGGLDALQPLSHPDGVARGGLKVLSKLCPHPDRHISMQSLGDSCSKTQLHPSSNHSWGLLVGLAG